MKDRLSCEVLQDRRSSGGQIHKSSTVGQIPYTSMYAWSIENGSRRSVRMFTQ